MMWRRITDTLNPPRPGQPREPGAAPAPARTRGASAPQAAAGPAPALKVWRYTFCQHALLMGSSLAGRLIFRRLHLDPTVVTDSRVIFERHRGTLVAMEAGYCLVGLVAYLFEFNAAESCGKCYPCRLGVHLIHRLLRGIMRGEGDQACLERLSQAARALAQAGYCQFGQRVSEPLLLALDLALPQFQRHLDQGGCAAGERHLWPANPGEGAP
ncbi:MAG: hypothetical protein HY794_00660 [Desulfarculus sp.]|nr:hypothetical protein [Desulfarculus sp.]